MKKSFNLSENLRKKLAIILLLSFSYLMFMTQFTTNGIIHIQQKEILNGQYYIYVNSIRLKCSETDFENVTAGGNLTYKMTYKTNYFTPEQGKLITIEYEPYSR